MLYYKIYDEITWKYLEPYIPIDPKALVLDAGGGTGRWSIRMAKKDCNVVLLDISKEMLNIAADKVKKEKLEHRITMKEGNTTRTEYPDETFDLILVEHALFLFKNPDVVIKEMNRILKKKARLIISAQNRYVQALVSLPDKPDLKKLDYALSVLLQEKYGVIDKSGKVKIYTWTPNEFKAMLERNGFYTEKIIGKGITMPMRIPKELFMKKKFPEDLFNKILRFELALCEKPDALGLAGHLQVIAHKI